MHAPRPILALAMFLSLVATFSFASLVSAAEVTLTANLVGSNDPEFPGDEDGSGRATIRIDADAGTVCWVITFENIGFIEQSHIQEGAEGERGPIVISMDYNRDGITERSEGCTESQDPEVLASILADPAVYYVSVPSDEIPTGALRGQLSSAEVPNTALFAAGTRSTPYATLLGVASLLGGLLLAGRLCRERARR